MLNHCFTNDLIEQLIKTKKVKGNLTQSKQNLKDMALELKRAIPFRLPDQGKLFGERPEGALLYDKYSFVFEQFRLPYPEVVLEHFTSPAGRVASQEYNIKFDATLIHLKEIEDGWVKGRVFFRRSETKKWDICNFGFKIKPYVSKQGLETYPVFETLTSDLLYHGKGLDVFVNDVGGEITTVIEFLAILHCTNVSVETKKPSKEVNKKRRAQGKKPLLAYKVLTIPGMTGEHHHRGGTHNSPRTHLRRGHIRRLSSGKRVWVNACLVNRDAKNGMVVKKYAVE